MLEALDLHLLLHTLPPARVLHAQVLELFHLLLIELHLRLAGHSLRLLLLLVLLPTPGGR